MLSDNIVNCNILNSIGSTSSITSLDQAAVELTEAITKAAKASIPTSKPGAKPKP
jgi:hypothetical protein